MPLLHVPDLMTHTGEQPHTGIVASITTDDTTTLITCVDDERLEFNVRRYGAV